MTRSGYLKYSETQKEKCVGTKPDSVLEAFNNSLDYKEIFSPGVRYDSLRVMLALVAAKDLELTQFDVQTAFLYGELEEEMWMKIPKALVVEGEKNSLACNSKNHCTA